MPRYPDTPNRYPSSPKAYPGSSAKLYPGASVAQYPIGLVAANFRQSSVVDASATLLGLVDFSQTSLVDATASPVGTVSPSDPLSIITSVPKAFYFNGDLGVTQSGGLVSQWNDQTANARHGTASGTARPSQTTIAGRNALQGDGTAVSLAVPYNAPAPGTTNLWFFLVMRQTVWTAGAYIFGGGNLALALVQSAVTPQLRQFNQAGGVNINGNLAVATGGGVEVFFSNSTSDYIRAGSVAAVTGANAGNTDVASLWLFSRNALGFSNVAVAAWLCTEGLPTPTEITNIRTWAAAYYPGITI